MNVTREPVAADVNRWKQPTVTRSLVLPDAAGVDLEIADAWLADGLQITVPEFPPTKETGDAEAPAYIVALAWRYLLLYREFLQLASYPIFDLGSVVSVARSPDFANSFAVELRVPHVTGLPAEGYQRANHLARELLGWIASRPMTAANRRALYDQLTKVMVTQVTTLHRGISSIPFLHAALELDAPVIYIGGPAFQYGWGSKARLQDRSVTDVDPQLGFRLSNLKTVAGDFMRNAGIPVPDNRLVATEDAARQVARQLGWPVVVKPEDRNGGVGITVAVDSDAALARAFALAQREAGTDRVIVERQHAGWCHRIFVFEGKLLFATKRMAPAVEGDGHSTVADLINRHNECQAGRPPWLREQLLPTDEETIAVIAAQGLRVTDVPASGRWVEVRHVESTRWGGRAEDMTDHIHPDNVAIAVRCAEIFRLGIAGIDLITPDVSVPWYENGAIICEINAAPMFGNFPLTRKLVRPLLSRLLGGGNGRIPVHAFIGGEEALVQARALQQALAAGGTATFLTTANETRLPSGDIERMACTGLSARCLALALDRRVDAVVVVAEQRADLDGLVFDRFDSIAEVGLTEGAASAG